MVRGEPRLTLIEWSRFAAVGVVGHPHTPSLAPWFRSLARSLIASCHSPLVVVPAAPRVSGRHLDSLLTAARSPAT
jgi:hypothetical protein